MHQELTETFRRDGREIARARQVVRGALRAWGLDAHVQVLELLVSELVSNSLVHGEGPIAVRLENDDGRVRLEVGDRGRSGTTPPEPHQLGRFGGWGLHFVDQLSERWGTQHDSRGTLVWTETRRA